MFLAQRENGRFVEHHDFTVNLRANVAQADEVFEHLVVLAFASAYYRSEKQPPRILGLGENLIVEGAHDAYR